MTIRTFVQEYKCPKGHRVVLTWRANEVETVLKTRGLRSYCILCDATTAATQRETDAILNALGLSPSTTA
jgi:hypothetical protein